jgi:hypothetical protein
MAQRVEIELPVLPDTATIRRAFGSLRENRKGAIVVSGRGAIMVSGRDLSQALLPIKDEDASLARVVETLGRGSPLSPPRPSSGFFGFLSKERPPAPVEDQYRVLKLDSRSALVLVSAEQVETLTNPATFYICTSDPSHVWLAEDLVRPGTCNLDGEPVQLKT